MAKEHFVRYPRSWFKTSESISVAKQLWEQNSGKKVEVRADENEIKFVFSEPPEEEMDDLEFYLSRFWLGC